MFFLVEAFVGFFLRRLGEILCLGFWGFLLVGFWCFVGCLGGFLVCFVFNLGRISTI